MRDVCASNPRYLPPCAPRFRGITLAELLVVLAILSALMGMSAGGYIMLSRRMKEDSAAGTLETAIRQVRNAALSSGAPAFIELAGDTHPPHAQGWSYDQVGLWHFENVTSNQCVGAFGRKALLMGALPIEGKIGQGLSFVSGRTTGYVDLGADKDFDLEEGGLIECYVFSLHNARATQFIFHKKNAYLLALEPSGALVGMVGKVQISTSDIGLPFRRWIKVGFAWDRRSSRLLMEDAVVAVGPGSKTPLNDEPLLVGDDARTFLGLVDEVRILAIVPGKAAELPEGAVLSHNVAPWNAVFFAADGSLDAHYHTGPVQIDVTQGTRRRSVTVSLLGQTRRLEVEKATAGNAEAGAGP